MRRSDAEELLVARQVAGLRAAGWSTLDAVSLVVEGLGDTGFKGQLAETLAALKAGMPQPGQDLLLATVARGEAATASSLGQLADALETQQAARAHARQMSTTLGVVLVLGSVLLTVGGWGLGTMAKQLYGSFGSDGSALPAPTVVALGLLGVLRWVGPVALVASVATVVALRSERLPGAQLLFAAAALRQYAGAVQSGVSEADALRLVDGDAPSLSRSTRLRLDSIERTLLDYLSARSGAMAAAQTLARELERAGRASSAAWAWWVPLAGAIAGLTFAGFVLIALYLPIFSIAGSIK